MLLRAAIQGVEPFLRDPRSYQTKIITSYHNMSYYIICYFTFDLLHLLSYMLYCITTLYYIMLSYSMLYYIVLYFFF